MCYKDPSIASHGLIAYSQSVGTVLFTRNWMMLVSRCSTHPQATDSLLWDAMWLWVSFVRSCQVAFDCILMPHHDSLAHSQSTMCRAFAECAPATPMKLPFAKVHEQWLGWHYYQGICRPGFALWGPWPSWPKPRSPSQGKTSRIMPVDLIKQSDFSSSTSVAPSSLVQLQRPLCPNFCIYSK